MFETFLICYRRIILKMFRILISLAEMFTLHARNGLTTKCDGFVMAPLPLQAAQEPVRQWTVPRADVKKPRPTLNVYKLSALGQQQVVLGFLEDGTAES